MTKLTRKDREQINSIMLQDAREYNPQLYSLLMTNRPELLQDYESGAELWHEFTAKNFATRDIEGSDLDDIYTTCSDEKRKAWENIGINLTAINHLNLQQWESGGDEFGAFLLGITSHNIFMYVVDWCIHYNDDYYIIRETPTYKYIKKSSRIECNRLRFEGRA